MRVVFNGHMIIVSKVIRYDAIYRPVAAPGDYRESARG